MGRIGEFLRNKYEYDISKEEQLHLTIHIAVWSTDQSSGIPLKRDCNKEAAAKSAVGESRKGGRDFILPG